MKKILIFWCNLLGLFAFSQASYSLDPQQLQALQNAVVSMCRGGTLEGKTSSYEIKGSANGKIIVVKNVAEGGADLSFNVSNEQWEGIKANANSEDYTECVKSTLPMLISLDTK